MPNQKLELARKAKAKIDKTLKQRAGGRNVLYIELKAPYPEQLKKLANRDNRSAKAQAEWIVMQHLNQLFNETN